MKIEFGNVFKITFYALASVAVMVLIVVTVTSGLIAKGMRDAKRAEEAAEAKSVKPEFPLDLHLRKFQVNREGMTLTFSVMNASTNAVLGFKALGGFENAKGDILHSLKLESEHEIQPGNVLELTDRMEWCRELDHLLEANEKGVVFKFVPQYVSVEPGRAMEFDKNVVIQTNVMAMRNKGF